MEEFSNSEVVNIISAMSRTIESIDTGEKMPDGHFDLDGITKDWKKATDDGLFENMAACIFVGGMRIKVIEQYWGALRQAFGNFKISYVANLKLEDLLYNSKIIRHKGKLSALITNAIKIQEIQKKEGSFKDYLQNRLNIGYDYLLKCVATDFKYVKKAVGPDFLKDIGMGGFKPDVHVVRILSRIGLYNQNFNTLPEVFERVSSLCGLEIPQVDRMLFRFGSGHKLAHPICGLSPLCDRCGVPKCYYAKRF